MERKLRIVLASAVLWVSCACGWGEERDGVEDVVWGTPPAEKKKEVKGGDAPGAAKEEEEVKWGNPRPEEKKGEEGEREKPAPVETPEEDVTWGKAPGGAGNGGEVEWGGGMLRIPAQDSRRVRFGPGSCPVALVGQEVWSLKTGRKTGVTLEGKLEEKALAAISPDGKFICSANEVGRRARGEEPVDPTVLVWSAETGKRLRGIPGNPEQPREMMLWAGSKHLLLGGRNGSGLEVWDPQAGKLLRTIQNDLVDRGRVAVAPNGKHVAMVEYGFVKIYDAGTGSPVATMRNPVIKSEAVPVGPRAKAGPAATISFASLLAGCKALEFSGDGKELAGIFDAEGRRLVVWSVRGDIVIQTKLVAGPPAPRWPMSPEAVDGLAWVPDGSGWLVGRRYLVDRKAKRSVLEFSQLTSGFFIDPETLLVRKGVGSTGRYEPMTIPWERIRKSIEAAGGKGPAYLRPGQAVSIQVEMEELRGNADEARKVIVEALRRRLTEENIPIAENAPAIFTIRFSESAGETLPVYQRERLGGFGGRDTGSKATEAKGKLVLALVARETQKVAWETVIRAESARSFDGAINDATVRQSMIENLPREIQRIQLPWFVPVEEDLARLPVEVARE